MRPGPNGAGLSRKAIFAEIDNSLRRLGMDYVDLYQIHRFDHDTPIEETLEALHDVVKAGKARYIGASSMHAWQFARALGIAEKNGWTRFVSMQNLVNLLYREEEREMLPLCWVEGIGVIPWSPQARGKLSRDWDYTSMRTETDEAITRLFAKTQEADKKVVDRVAEVANARGIPRAQVALTWLLAKPVITAPIVGATKLHHLGHFVRLVRAESFDLGCHVAGPRQQEDVQAHARRRQRARTAGPSCALEGKSRTTHCSAGQGCGDPRSGPRWFLGSSLARRQRRREPRRRPCVDCRAPTPPARQNGCDRRRDAPAHSDGLAAR
jgi:diketogulonate reductase-like aldo/keto reductase